jgi:hypothetical protein
MPVPDLFGLSYGEALALLEANGVTLGVVLPDADLSDTASGFVYWQNPQRFNEEKVVNRIRAGQMMDIKLSVTKPERQTEDAGTVAPGGAGDGNKTPEKAPKIK